MRKLPIFSAVLTLFLLIPASITWAQKISSEKGLTTAVFQTQYGKIKVYLPDDIRPGDMISGTILTEPKGNNTKQTEKNLAELKKYSISFSNEKFPVDNGNKSIRFLIQADKPVSNRLELVSDIKTLSGEVIEVKMATAAIKNSLVECEFPTHALCGSPLRITGQFDGDMSNTQCSLDNKPLEILAESPRQCIISYPADAGGMHTLNEQEKGKMLCSKQISGVIMNVSAGDLNLKKGQRTFIDVNITGLQNLKDTAFLSLNNVTISVVVMLPSNNIIIPFFPDSIGNENFQKRFDIQSIKTGSFTVNVDLDLPEVNGDNPPTKPQEEDNPQPKDSTIHPPTVAQCPACNCTAKASIIFAGKEGKEKDVFSYSVEVAAACTGFFGTPPCEPCGIKAYDYEWTISYSADKPIEIIGDNKGAGFKFKNPKDGAFTLSVAVTVICSGRSSCKAAAKTSYLPTTTINPPGKCECKPGCSIKKVKTRGDEVDYTADIIAECKGLTGRGTTKVQCSVVSVTTEWSIGVSGKEVASIKGKADGASVTVKLKKGGAYNLYCKVVVTCSDGSVCESVCSFEEYYIPPPPTTTECGLSYEWCKGPSIKVKSYGFYPDNDAKDVLNDFRPGDLIGISAFATDFDYLMQRCLCPEGLEFKKHPINPDEVFYDWELKSIGRGGHGSLITDPDPASIKFFQPEILFIPFCLTLTYITTHQN